MSVAGFIACQRTEHRVPHAIACRALGVSQSWFYKWRGRPPTPRQARRAQLTVVIQRVFDASGRSYGSPRVQAELRETGWRVSAKTIAAIMRELGLVARPKRHRRSLTPPGHGGGAGAGPARPGLHRRRGEPQVVRRHHRDPHR